MTDTSHTSHIADTADTALIVVDVQQGFEAPVLGRRDNPVCETNIAALVGAWRGPVVLVRHVPAAPVEDVEHALAPGTPGAEFKPLLRDLAPDLLVDKNVHSAFLGAPDLDAWLRGRGIGRIAVCGIQTNRCCESTARHGCDLGYDVRFVADACHTFDKPDLADPSRTVTAEELARATAVTLHGYFATVVTTADLLAEAQTVA